jgi:hypothetical protein
MLCGVGLWHVQCEMAAATRFAVLDFGFRCRQPVHTTASSAANKALLKARSTKFS